MSVRWTVKKQIHKIKELPIKQTKKLLGNIMEEKSLIAAKFLEMTKKWITYILKFIKLYWGNISISKVIWFSGTEDSTLSKC